jgi:hypothetical protein
MSNPSHEDVARLLGMKAEEIIDVAHDGDAVLATTKAPVVYRIDPDGTVSYEVAPDPDRVISFPVHDTAPHPSAEGLPGDAIAAEVADVAQVTDTPVEAGEPEAAGRPVAKKAAVKKAAAGRPGESDDDDED